jgi:hypothetical protein
MRDSTTPCPALRIMRDHLVSLALAASPAHVVCSPQTVDTIVQWSEVSGAPILRTMKNVGYGGERPGTARLATMSCREAKGHVSMSIVPSQGLSVARQSARAAPGVDSEESEGRSTSDSLIRGYMRCGAATEALAAPLSSEDQQLQSMPSCSPTKWHRAHTTWFFEASLLQPAGVPAHDERFGRLFNSYYESVGERVARDRRGLLSRPSSVEVAAYRRHVGARLADLLESLEPAALVRRVPFLELGLAHEEQHQELILTDILHAFSESPCAPAYREGTPPVGSTESRVGRAPRQRGCSAHLARPGRRRRGARSPGCRVCVRRRAAAAPCLRLARDL